MCDNTLRKILKFHLILWKGTVSAWETVFFAVICSSIISKSDWIGHGRIIEETDNFALKIFFLIYPFIRLNVSVYILMIYKWSKIIAWYAFWLNINETQPWNFIGKNCNPIFLDSTLFFAVSLVSQCVKLIYKSSCVYIIYFIFHSSLSFDGISVGF